jgi:hypothetical protein
VEAWSAKLHTDTPWIKIWNIPGMSVSQINPAIEVTNSTTDADPSDWTIGLGNIIPALYNGTLVLIEDVPLTGTWTPIGDSTNAFTGKFYGNGHTVSINNITATDDMGLFGMVSGGVVRDLTVVYDGNPSALSGPAATARFGGVAGNVTGPALLENVQVEGAATFNINGTNTAYIGGIIGLLGRTSNMGDSSTARINNAYSSLNLTVNKGPTGSGSLYIGGITGSMGFPGTGTSNSNSITTGGDAVRAEGVTVLGNITVGSDAAKVGASVPAGSNGEVTGLHLGGLAGIIRGADNMDGKRAVLHKSEYRQGTISIWINAGRLYIGGAIGSIYQYANITDCFSVAGEITYSQSGSMPSYAGGFIGEFWRNGTIKNCYSENSLNASRINGIGNFTLRIGGFGGRLAAQVEYCYAKGDVSGSNIDGNTGRLNIGGFAGEFTDDGSASYCYATGNVRAMKTSIYAGGFAGVAQNLSNCYALGDVFADDTQYAIQAGGLAGQLKDSTIVEKCFAAGSVIAQSSGSVVIYAGGLVGFVEYASSAALQHSAALGASVTATGGGTRNIGRVYGTVAGTTLVNNHVYDGMRLYSDATYRDGSPAELTISGQAHDNKDGKDATDSDFHRRDIWQNAPPASGAPASNHGLGFSGDDWIFTDVNTDGYPTLRSSKNGPAMGGQ